MAERNLCEPVAAFEYDNLFADVNPAPVVGAFTLTADTDMDLKRGTLFSIDGGLYGGSEADEAYTPAGVLCEDVHVDANETVTVAVYKCGCFNANALIVAEGVDLAALEVTAKTTLDLAGIYLKFAQESGD